ncbi:hypothetical protein QGM71_16870 [Virgibacillus sp. C22-A2]|uniref:Uncharacterized protein n=1 Tax=Virgibacillus tibetensis TaxID=3042313 RepID=A0ABU6KJ85_9BACI|nr:hypothetical protein [Virgibacillus sp. C22-A2]
MDGNKTVEDIKDSYIKLIKEQSPWPEGYTPEKINLEKGTKINMVLSPRQPSSRPCGFGTL